MSGFYNPNTMIMIKNKLPFRDIFNDSYVFAYMLSSKYSCHINLISWLSLVLQDFVVKGTRFVANSNEFY